jgi:hypothetical protein
MELSELHIDKKKWTAKEVSRIRIPAPIDETSYCEKNWMPILDREFQYIKWTSPTEVVKADPNEPKCEQVSHKEGNASNSEQRGGSQVIKWGDKYIAITHEVVLFKNYMKQKNATYRHRLCVWNDEFVLEGMSPSSWSFLDGQIEFCAGAAQLGDDLLITFGYVDNAAFVLQVPGTLVNSMIAEALNV